MQSSKKSPKTSGSSSAATKTVKAAAPVKKAPAANKPAVEAAAAKKAPAVKKTAVKAATVKKAPAAKKPASKHKHVKFQVQTKPGSKVFIGGDFNEWNHLLQELIDQDGNGVYEVVIALEPGVYEYKFHINDNWCIDPDNSNFRQNVMGTLNSVIIVE